jgi:integrase
MPYQYKREPLTPDEANRLASACETHQERLIVWTLLDTGLRVSELAGLTREHIDWQNHRLMIYGKGGIYGTKSKRRILPLTDRIRPLIDGHFAIHDIIRVTRTVKWRKRLTPSGLSPCGISLQGRNSRTTTATMPAIIRRIPATVVLRAAVGISWRRSIGG